MWVERLARGEATIDAYPFPFTGDTLDFRPLLNGVIRERLSGRKISEIARAFHRGIAVGLRDALAILRREHRVDTVALSGGVFQNELLLSDLKALLESEQLEIWTNHAVPANDGGISLGQAALAALANWQSGGALEESDSASVAHRT